MQNFVRRFSYNGPYEKCIINKNFEKWIFWGNEWTSLKLFDQKVLKNWGFWDSTWIPQAIKKDSSQTRWFHHLQRQAYEFEQINSPKFTRKVQQTYSAKTYKEGSIRFWFGIKTEKRESPTRNEQNDINIFLKFEINMIFLHEISFI